MNLGLVGGGAVSAVAGGILLAARMWLRRLGAASLTWPKAPGRVVASSVAVSVTKDNNDNETTQYTPRVDYAYEVEGKALSGKTIAHQSYSGIGETGAQAIVARYPVGADVTVSYDPARPTRSVLEPGMQKNMMLLVTGLIFFPIGIVLILVGLVTTP